MLKKIHIYIIDELMFFPIILVNWSLWTVSGLHKINEIITKKAWVAPDGWIPWLHTHFHGTFLNIFVEPLFYVLTFLQVLAGLLLSIAIIKLEFFDNNKKDFFKAGLFVGALCIGAMSFAQNVANADDDVFQLSAYLTTTMISYLFILLYPKLVINKR